jgi:uncharacterized protein (DUF305 family)
MRTPAIASRLAAAVGIASLALCSTFANAQAPAQGQPKQQGMAHDASKGMHASMMKGMKEMQSMRTSGDVDRDFASMMRMHHQQAIDMAREELRNGKDAEMKAMAQKIVDDQSKEVKELDDWLAKRKR